MSIMAKMINLATNMSGMKKKYSLPYFRESKEDFDEIAQILAK